jgi:hypothetical protein
MEALVKIFRRILFSLGIYCVLTLPMITKLLFDFGLVYPMWLIGTIAGASAVISYIICGHYFEK